MKPQFKSTSKAITQSFQRMRAMRTMAGLLIAVTLGVICHPFSHSLLGSAAAQ